MRVNKIGQVKHGGRWHLLRVRAAMTAACPTTFFEAILYPICGSVPRGYFHHKHIVAVTYGETDCLKCIKIRSLYEQEILSIEAPTQAEQAS